MYVEIMVTKWLPEMTYMAVLKSTEKKSHSLYHCCVEEHRKEIPFTVYENKFWSLLKWFLFCGYTRILIFASKTKFSYPKDFSELYSQLS